MPGSTFNTLLSGLSAWGPDFLVAELSVTSRNVVFLLARQAEGTLELFIKYFGCSICVSCFIPSSVTCRLSYILTDFKAHNKIKPWKSSFFLGSGKLAGEITSAFSSNGRSRCLVRIVQGIAKQKQLGEKLI